MSPDTVKTAHTPDIPPPLHSALCVVVAGICAALHIWKLPPALPGLQADFGLDLIGSGFLLSIIQLAGMSLGLPIGLMAERIGLRRCILSGLGIIAIASTLGALFDAITLVLLFRAIEGCGFLMVALPAPPMIRRLVSPASLSRVMGLWSCHMPIGTITVLIVGAWVLTLVEWRTLWLLLAALTAAVLWLVWVMVPSDATHRQKQQGTLHPIFRPSVWQSVKLTLSTGKVWLVALIFGTYSGQWMAVIGFLPTIYTASGVNGATAALLTSLVAGANIAGNLLAGQLLHRNWPAGRLIVTGFSAMILCAFIAFGSNAAFEARFIAVVFFSAFGGLIPATLFVLAIAVAPSPQTTTTTVGWMQQCSSLGQFSGPPVVAWVVSQAGGWQWTWLATGSYALAGILLALTLHGLMQNHSEK